MRKYQHQILVLLGVIALLSSLGSQYLLNWQPCIMCIVQRTCFLGMLLLSLGHNYIPTWVSKLGYSSFTGIGLWYAIKQLLLQSSGEGCSNLLNPNPIEAAILYLSNHISWFMPTGLCTDTYPILGLPMAAYSMALITLMGGLALTLPQKRI